MPQYIQTNVSSLFAQSFLNRSQSALQTSLERLSSGYRINSAKDDAAGLAISADFTSQINGMTRARANAADGIGMTQTAEGTLATMTKMLQRMRELAVQSANATNTSSNRQALQEEMTQTINEIDRQARATQFNGRELLDGSLGTVAFQVGANSGQTIQASIGSFLSNQFGLNRTSSRAPIFAAAATDAQMAAKQGNLNSAASETVTMNGQTFTIGDVSAKDAAQLINSKTASTGVKAKAETDATVTFGGSGNYTLKLAGTNATTDPSTIRFSVGETNTIGGLQSAADAFNSASGKTGVTASVVTDAAGAATLHLQSKTGETIYLSNNDATVTNADTVTVGGATIAAAGAADNNMAITGNLTLDSSDAFITGSTVAGATAAAPAGFFGGAGISKSKLHAVSTMNILDFSNASQAIDTIDAALKRINEERASLGAVQARFEKTIENLQGNEANMSNARSRIMDTDFASETANMTKNQILQQAGTAMLAQANQAPQLVLSLLK